MKIKERDLKIMFSEQEIQARIKELAGEINTYFNGEEVYAVCVLKRAGMFAVDLVKILNMPLRM